MITPNPQKTAAMLFLLIFAGLSSRLEAGGVGAMVIAGNNEAKERTHIICQHRIEGSLRQMGFAIMDNRRDPCEAGLVVVIARLPPEKSMAAPLTYRQPVHLQLMRPEGPVKGEPDCRSGNMIGRKLADLKLTGESKSGWPGSLRDACQQLDKEVKERAEQALGILLAHKQVKTTLTLRWKNRLQPLPLLKVIPFLRDFIGAPPEMLSSDGSHCRFQFHLDDPHGVFKERLQSFLLKHWSIQSSSGDPLQGSRQLEFHLSPKKD